MRIESLVVPNAYALYAPSTGYLLAVAYRTRAEATVALADRKANGEAFPLECVRKLRIAALNIAHDGSVTGFVTVSQ